MTQPDPDAISGTAALDARLEAAESRLSEALALTRQVVGQLDQAHHERAAALAQVATLQATIATLGAALDAALAAAQASPAPQRTAYQRALALARRALDTLAKR